MPTVKSIIVPSVSPTLSAAYTNSSGSNATLKAINATGIGNPDVWTVDANEATEWTYFGTANPTFIPPQSATAGNTAPFPIQLSADRLLLLWTPANIHCGGGNDYLGGTVLHTQIVEYTGTIYRAGPIVNLLLPSAAFNSQTVGIWTSPGSMSAQGQTCVKGIALTSTKVALVYRVGSDFRLMRLNISGNSLDQANVVEFNLAGGSSFNSTSAFAFDVAPVLGDTNQVVVGGSNGTNWSLQSFNIPNSGSITTASSLFSTGLAHTTHHFAMAPLTATVIGTTTTYVVAANTSTGVTLSVQHFSYNSSTLAFGSVGTAVTVTNTNTLGIQARTLSTDTTANAVVSYFNTGTATTLEFLSQTSITQAANAIATATLPSSTASRSLKASWNWGQERAVFLTDMNGIVVVDSAGTRTPLVTSVDSTSTTASQPLWYPFNSRPLYTFFNAGTNVAQFISRTGITSSTSVGTATLVKNYFPHGFTYNGNASWSTKANCWFVGQGGKLYAMSTNGAVLNELNLYNLFPAISTNAYLLSIKQVEVLPSGGVVFLTDTQGTNAASGYYGLYWDSLSSAGNYAFAISPVNNYQELNNSYLLSVPTSFSTYRVCVDLVSYVDVSGIERAFGLYVNSSTNAFISVVSFDGSTWSALGNTSVANAAVNSAFNFGARPNFSIIQDAPVSSAYPTGLWRFIGAIGINSAQNMTRQGISATAFAATAMTSQAVNTTLNNSVNAVYPATKATSIKSVVVAMHDTNLTVDRFYFAVDGSIQTGLFGFTIPGSSSNQFMNSIAGKYGFVVSPCSTSISANAQPIYVFDTIDPSAGPRYSLTATSGNGWTTLLRENSSQLNVFAAGVNNQYTVSGPDTAYFNATVSSLSNDFHILPVDGQPIDTSTVSSYRNSDVYLIPNGYSVKLKSTLPGSLSAMLTIVEDA